MPKTITGEHARAVHRAPETPPPPGGGRLVTLDLIRGVAILGILAINVSGFAGPAIGALSPDFPSPSHFANEAAWGFGFLFFEGKMRVLFAMLFGAGIALQCERMDTAGRDGDVIQVRRLSWLMVFGTLHYLLLWWGDILFVYACCGLALLFLRRLSGPVLLGIAAGISLTAMAIDFWSTLPLVRAEEAVRLGTASLSQQQDVFARLELYRQNVAAQALLYHSGFTDIALTKLRGDPFWLFRMTAHAWSEVLPLMLIGVVLLRGGFFSGTWPRRRICALSLGAGATGLALTSAVLLWSWSRHFPPIAMAALLGEGLFVPHLLTALGYASLLILAAPRLTRTGLGRRLMATGRVAFSNYIGTSLLMCWLFYGWGLGLYGQVGPLGQWLFVAMGCAAMLGWSELWLSRFQRGPLELLWRALVLQKRLKNRLPATA